MTTYKRTIIPTLLLAACGSARSKAQGDVVGEHVTCAATAANGRFDCAAPLREFLRTKADARVAGINVIYGDGRNELLVWLTTRSDWPKASSLLVDDHECSVAASNTRDCANVIDDLSDEKPPNHHYFIVPVYAAPDEPASPGSWSVLDVRAADGIGRSELSWDTVKVELVPCRLEKGDPLLSDQGNGVKYAVSVGSALDGPAEGPTFCMPALIKYLRAHAEQKIAGIVALDGARAVRPGGSLSDPATNSLAILAVSAGWPRADSLSVTSMACTEPNCVDNFAATRPKLKVSPRTLFTVPIGETISSAPNVPSLILVSTVK